MSVPPLVVAIMVAHDPGEWFEEALRSLSGSDYPNLSIVVVDNASKMPLATRASEAVPEAFMVRNEVNLGFGNAVNEAVKNVPTASYLLVCHDDVVLAPDAVSVMVEDALRMNASIVAPKVVAWSYPDRVLSLGYDVDRTAAMRTRVDVGDLDQDQFAIVEEVFAASSAAMLVRHDLFVALGGFDPEMFLFGEDVDLSYRAQLAGARAISSSYAKVRHMGVLVSGPERVYYSSAYQPIRNRLPRSERTYYVRANQMRSIKNNSVGFARRISILQLWVLAISEATYFALTGRPKTSKAILRSLRDGARMRAEFAGWRAIATGSRMLENREIGSKLANGSMRLSAFFAHQRNTRAQLRYEVERSKRSDKGAIVTKDLLDQESTDPTAIATRYIQRRLARVIQAVTVVYLLVASRHLILGTLPLTGSFASFPHASSLLSDFFSGSLSPSVSLPTSVPASYLWIGVLGLPFFGATGLFTHLFLIGLIAMGLLGAFRLGAKYRNPLSASLAMFSYLVTGSLISVFSAASFFGLVTFAVAPWILGQLADFVEGQAEGKKIALRPFFRAAFVGAVATSLAPGFIVVYLVLAFAVTVAFAVSGKMNAQSFSRQARFVVGILVVMLLANASWFLGYLSSGATLASLFGSLGPRNLSLWSLVHFATTRAASVNPLGYLAMVALVVTPFVARGVRSFRAEFAAVAAVIVFIFMAAANGGALGSDPLPLVYFAPALGAFASYAVANAVDSLYRDLPRESFGYRQVSGVALVLGLAGATLGLSGPFFGGNLGLNAVSYSNTLDWVTPGTSTPTRLVWVGSPSTIPAGSWRLGPGVGLAVTTNRNVTFENIFTPIHLGESSILGKGLTRAAGFETTQLGSYLASAGVRYLIYPQTGQNATVAAVTLALARQQDLTQVLTDPSVTGYQVSGPQLASPPRPADGDLLSPLAVGLFEVIVWLFFVDLVFFGAFVSSRIVTRIRVSRATERDWRDATVNPSGIAKGGHERKHAGAK